MYNRASIETCIRASVGRVVNMAAVQAASRIFQVAEEEEEEREGGGGCTAGTWPRPHISFLHIRLIAHIIANSLFYEVIILGGRHVSKAKKINCTEHYL